MEAVDLVGMVLRDLRRINLSQDVTTPARSGRIVHDARLYLGFALAPCDPDGIGGDLVFVHDGQSRSYAECLAPRAGGRTRVVLPCSPSQSRRFTARVAYPSSTKRLPHRAPSPKPVSSRHSRPWL